MGWELDSEVLDEIMSAGVKTIWLLNRQAGCAFYVKCGKFYFEGISSGNRPRQKVYLPAKDWTFAKANQCPMWVREKTTIHCKACPCKAQNAKEPKPTITYVPGKGIWIG